MANKENDPIVEVIPDVEESVNEAGVLERYQIGAWRVRKSGNREYVNMDRRRLN
ncbi:hypothetical protein SAMN05444392_11826 [Seinonella peptonophila]|uniref:Uncharacterized protein n=1 Tax=Seinonella peptonophila TaxID=112248 RepID=A0A1M5B4N1_9BACL|nr:hypothetical protein SAMN05444392_11826 [Seinonella peptonophila]